MRRYLTTIPCVHGHVGEWLVAGSRCVQCVRDRNAAARIKNANILPAIKRDEYLKNKADPVWQQKQREKRAREKEAKRLYDIEYRARLPKGYKTEKAKRWAKANPEKRRAISKSYKARRRQQEAGGDSTAAILEWERQAKKVCYWCGSRCAKEYHIDHYEPLARGGRHEISNLVIACPPCNLRKNAKDPYEFASSVGRLF